REGTSELLDNATSVLGRLETDHHDLEIRLTKARSELDILGDTGLHDQLDIAWTRLARHEQVKALLDRRVEAAALLHETLARHRDASKRAYAEPFRQELERLGRVVFGTSLSIQLDHETLQIVSRTLDGVTVPYESLSTGAREQLCLLSRLACALLVSPATPDSPDAGVPVVIDDALGYSDHTRLERLGAVLNMAGRQSQVIVLTCVPERYRNVGVATVVRLEPARLGEGTQATSILGPLLVGSASTDPAASTRSSSADAGGPGGLDDPGPSPRRPSGAGTTSAAGEQVLAFLRDAGIPLAKADVLARVDVPEAMWSATIGALVADGRVLQHGRKRGTRYEAVPGR
ncbi:MAG: ATP-binding protein, partial [Acidimicrobiales bacterium]